VADHEAAVVFIQSNGDELERARLRRLLFGATPPPQVVDQLLAGQQANGGWTPSWAPDYASIDATCFHLAQASQLGVVDEPAVKRATGFLIARQSNDGWWEEERIVAQQAPPWAKPGELHARLYLTANAGLWLAVLSAGAADAAAANRAAAYLAAHVSTDGRFASFLHTHWLAGCLFWRVGDEDLARSVFDCIHGRLQDLAASNLAWLGVSLFTAGVPREHALARAAAEVLQHEQQPYGRWVSEDGPQNDVHTTLEALHVLLWQATSPKGSGPAL